MYNQANSYNQAGYNSQMYSQQVYPPQPVYNQHLAQPYGQVYGQPQYGPGYYQQSNSVIIRWWKFYFRR